MNEMWVLALGGLGIVLLAVLWRSRRRSELLDRLFGCQACTMTALNFKHLRYFWMGGPGVHSTRNGRVLVADSGSHVTRAKLINW